MLLIREISTNDYKELNELMCQFGFTLSQHELIVNINKYIRREDYAAFVAVIDNKVVGFIGLVIINYFHRVGCSARVISLVVDESYRNQAIGSQLLEYIEKYASAFGCDKIELTSGMHRQKSGAHCFYRERGYRDDLSLYLCKLFEKKED